VVAKAIHRQLRRKLKAGGRPQTGTLGRSQPLPRRRPRQRLATVSLVLISPTGDPSSQLWGAEYSIPSEAEIFIDGLKLTEVESKSIRVAVYTLACVLAEDLEMLCNGAACTRHQALLRNIMTFMETENSS
jgi:hypothetical protein